MGVIFRMAVRNLTQHKSKTIIIGLFIAVGVMIVELGNGFLEATNRGMERDFRAHYTGDLVISAPIPKDALYMDMFQVESTTMSMDGARVPAIQDIAAVESVVQDTGNIKAYSKFISTQGIMMENGIAEFEIDDDTNFAALPLFLMFSGEPDRYFDLFPSIQLTAGRTPAAGTNELLIDEELRDNFEEFFRKPLNLGDTVLIAGAATRATLREAVIVGFYRQPDKNSTMSSIVYADPSFARIYAKLTYSAAIESSLPENVDMNLSQASEDDLFGGDDDFFGDDGFFDDFEDGDLLLADTSAGFDDILGDTTLRDKLNETDDGAWQFVVMKLDNATSMGIERTKAQIEKAFEDRGIAARVMTWNEAARSFTTTVDGISIIFTALVIILAVVVFFIIMNTMTISVLERTGEIGTMRALGSHKDFIRKLFVTESLTIAVVSATAGTVLALIIMVIVNACDISVSNTVAKLLLGGGSIKLIPTVTAIAQTVLLILAGSLLANLYPVSAALRVTPLKALSKGDE